MAIGNGGWSVCVADSESESVALGGARMVRGMVLG
jgi:hypothetical protein